MKQNQNFVEKVVDTENIFKSQWELKVKKTKLSIGRENAGDQVMIGFSFFHLIGWASGGGFLDQSQNIVIK